MKIYLIKERAKIVEYIKKKKRKIGKIVRSNEVKRLFNYKILSSFNEIYLNNISLK